MNAIFTRRSVRQFEEKEVEDLKVTQILRAAMQAPSAANQQPWEFIVVRGAKNLESLAAFNPYASCLKGANVGIVVLGNTERMIFPENWQQDLGAVTQNIQIEAADLGLGSVWFGTAPVDERMDYIRNLYKLGENLMPYSVLALGYPKEKDANKFVDRFDESRITYIGE